MQTITKFGPKSVANAYALLVAITMFLLGLGIGASNGVQQFAEGGITFMSAVWIIVYSLGLGVLVGLVSALLAAIVAYVFGYLIAWLYNRAVDSNVFGGVKIDIE